MYYSISREQKASSCRAAYMCMYIMRLAVRGVPKGALRTHLHTLLSRLPC